jgi:hypothetical protein
MTLKSLSILNPVNPPHFPPPLILHLSFPKLHNHLITDFGFLFMSSFKKTNYCARSSTLRAKIFRVRPLIVHFPRSRPLHWHWPRNRSESAQQSLWKLRKSETLQVNGRWCLIRFWCWYKMETSSYLHLKLFTLAFTHNNYRSHLICFYFHGRCSRRTGQFSSMTENDDNCCASN